jgi:hypothetical protein
MDLFDPQAGHDDVRGWQLGRVITVITVVDRGFAGDDSRQRRRWVAAG